MQRDIGDGHVGLKGQAEGCERGREGAADANGFGDAIPARPAHAYDQGDADERAWYGGRCNRVDKGYGEKAVVINLMQPEPDDGIE